MALFKRPNGYSKIENEDPEETKHRMAQFLIYKSMQKAHQIKRRPSWLRVRMLKLKIMIGKKMKKLKRGLSLTMCAAKADFCKQICCVLKSCKHLLQGKQGPIARTLPQAPVF